MSATVVDRRVVIQAFALLAVEIPVEPVPQPSFERARRASPANAGNALCARGWCRDACAKVRSGTLEHDDDGCNAASLFPCSAITLGNIGFDV
jgi:hypothetical protein